MKRTLSIGDTAKITGVTLKQLRNWEKKDFLCDIQRVVCGERAYRRYSEADIEHIKAIKAYLDEGFTLPAAAAKHDMIHKGRTSKMSRLDGKQCPFYKEECLMSRCAIYDERLDNCAIHLVVYNLYKLDRTLVEGMPPDQTGPIQFPFPPQK